CTSVQDGSGAPGPAPPYSQFPISLLFPFPKRKAPQNAGPSSPARGSLPRRHHAHGAAALGALHREVHHAVDQREERVVAAAADARARMELGAALADDDVAGLDDLTAVQLHAQVLRVGIAAVPGGAACLF